MAKILYRCLAAAVDWPRHGGKRDEGSIGQRADRYREEADAVLRSGQPWPRKRHRPQTRDRAGHITLKTFSAGEVYCRIDESVRGADVFIVQPTCANPETGISANDAMMELLVMIDAAVGASAHRVIAVMPWYGYSRQDKKSALRELITARLVAQLLETTGADRVLTVDLHAGQVQGFFRKPVDHMTALLLIAEYFTGLDLDDLVVVAPDVGRVKLNHKFADMLGADLALMTQGAPRPTGRRGRLRDRRRA